MATHRAVKDRLYDEFAHVGKAVSSPARIEILDLLSQGERTVEDIARQTGLSVKNTSAHLRVLRQAQLVASRKEPPYQYYRLAEESVSAFVRELQLLARRRLAEADRIVRLYYESADELEPVSLQELQGRLAGGDVVLVDVRPPEEYRAGHIPGARSIPVEELEQRLSELPRNREIVAYCRGPFCLFSVEAVALLRGRGRRRGGSRPPAPDAG
jgi:rhodanese-related sulfurtransferase/DNA-binding CsgD family transcriptional regulator